VIDDADFLFPHMMETLRECCSESVAVTAGSRFIGEWCSQFNPQVRVVWTGSPAPRRRVSVPNKLRRRVVTWACSDPLSYSHDFDFVCRVLRRLRERVEFDFWLFGLKSDGEADSRLEPLRGAGIRMRTFHFMSYKRFLRTLQGAAVGLCPLCVDEHTFDRGKSFGKVLAYITSHVAVVAGHEADHALFFKDRVNGLLCRTEQEWPAAIEDLLENPLQRQAITDIASEDFMRQLSSSAIAKELDAALRAATTSKQQHSCGSAVINVIGRQSLHGGAGEIDSSISG
jgi:glycosyltransferase involved in cell wall biosynthesis